MKKILLVVFDGLSDLPIPELGGKTPLEVAKIPNIEKLAAMGISGLQNAHPKGVYPASDDAHFELFGYDSKRYLPGRGVLEALGLGIDLDKRDLALRVNFGAVDENLRVLDPRAGNIKDVRSLTKLIAEKNLGPFNFKLYAGLLHRAVLVMSGVPISKEIHHHSTIVSDTDPHKAVNHRGGDKVIIPEAIDGTPEAKMTAKYLWEYQLQTHRTLDQAAENEVRVMQGLLPANFLLTRGAGFLGKIESFDEKYNLKSACVAGGHLYKGIAKYLGMEVEDIPGATADFNTDIKAKVTRSLDLFDKGYNFVYLHLKGTDVVAEEDGDWDKKIQFIERADKEFSKLLGFNGIICITGDHSTPCILKDHSDDPVPILISGGEKDNIGSFNEKDCAKGGLGHIMAREIIPKLIGEAENV